MHMLKAALTARELADASRTRQATQYGAVIVELLTFSCSDVS